MDLDTSDEPEHGSRPPERIACIELDRFCQGCGYNLRTLPVFLDQRTSIPIVRCTECGRYQSANDASTARHIWLARGASLLLGVWILAIIAGAITLAIGLGAISYATLDELTHYSGSTVQRIGNTTIRTSFGTGPLEVDADFRDFWLFIAAVMAASLGMTLAGGLALTVVLPHWRRDASIAVAAAVPLIVAGLIAVVWNLEAPHLFEWALPFVAAHAAAQVLGALAGVAFGRSIARSAVRLFLPPGLRPALAYLWLADGKLPPTRARPSESVESEGAPAPASSVRPRAPGAARRA